MIFFKNFLFSKYSYLCPILRDVAQLVARHVRDVEAAGSSPVIPTFYSTSCF